MFVLIVGCGRVGSAIAKRMVKEGHEVSVLDESEEAHAGHFWIRDLASDGVRPLDRYLERLSDIRYLQDYIVERAERQGVPVIDNQHREGATSEVMELVLTAADRLQKVG